MSFFLFLNTKDPLWKEKCTLFIQHSTTMAAPILSKKSVCIITGASRGLGRSIAVLFSKQLPPGSLFILLSRNIDLLNQVASLIQENDGIRAVTAMFDQGSGDQSDFDNIIINCLSKAKVSSDEFDQSIIINNAGTLEPLEFIRDLDNIAVMANFFQTNLVGYLALTAKFLQLFKSSVTDLRVVVNISSLAAVTPIKSWNLYCMGELIFTLKWNYGKLFYYYTKISCKIIVKIVFFLINRSYWSVLQ